MTCCSCQMATINLGDPQTVLVEGVVKGLRSITNFKQSRWIHPCNLENFVGADHKSVYIYNQTSIQIDIKYHPSWLPVRHEWYGIWVSWSVLGKSAPAKGRATGRASQACDFTVEKHHWSGSEVFLIGGWHDWLHPTGKRGHDYKPFPHGKGLKLVFWNWNLCENQFGQILSCG